MKAVENSNIFGRSLHWERGLKLELEAAPVLYDWSLPSLGAWIETRMCQVMELPWRCRSLHWERGLKPILHREVRRTV